MKVAERRKAIVNLLLSAKEPISGGELAQKFEISRQIIVQDITVVQAVLLMIAILTVICNLISDILMGILDPRIRLAMTGGDN